MSFPNEVLVSDTAVGGNGGAEFKLISETGSCKCSVYLLTLYFAAPIFSDIVRFALELF
jgi:hypothetical protein